MLQPVLARLADRRAPALLLDGALGTQLAGMNPVCAASVDRPEAVRRLYEGYFGVGADIIHTNTFGATRHDLALAGRHDVRAINLGAALLAREVRPTGRWVLGDVSPPWRADLADGELIDGHAEQAALLAEGGVDGLHLETQHDPRHLACAVAGARRGAPALPLLISLTVAAPAGELCGVSGTPVRDLLVAIAAAAGPEGEHPPLVLGLNCTLPPAPMLRAFEQARALDPRFLLFQPVAATPPAPAAEPDVFAALTASAVALGARAVGGCCGSTPDHIRALREALDRATPDAAPAA